MANKAINCELVKIKNKININSFERVSSGTLKMNDVAECEFILIVIVIFCLTLKIKVMEAFVLIDKQTNLTVAAGVIKNVLRRFLIQFCKKLT